MMPGTASANVQAKQELSAEHVDELNQEVARAKVRVKELEQIR